MNEQEIYTKAIAMWGTRNQSDIVIQEMSELTKAIIDYRRGRCGRIPIIEEIVDVQIMLNQMKIMVNNDEEYNKWMTFKLTRLQGLIEYAKNGEPIKS